MAGEIVGGVLDILSLETLSESEEVLEVAMGHVKIRGKV